MLIDARLLQDGGWADARILNVSRRGLLVRSAKTPARGAYVEICRGAHRIVARVVWVSHDRFGLRTQDAIAVDAVVAGDETAPPCPANDRRAFQRQPSYEDRADNSRRWSRRIEFSALSLVICVAALLAFDVVLGTLSRPLNLVGTTLSVRR